jgi:hypothetical protein
LTLIAAKFFSRSYISPVTVLPLEHDLEIHHLLAAYLIWLLMAREVATQIPPPLLGSNAKSEVRTALINGFN